MNWKKWAAYIFFLVLYFFISFYGYGPVLFADGGEREKMIGLITVTLIVVVLSVFLIRWMLKRKVSMFFLAPPLLLVLTVVVFWSGIWQRIL